MATAWGRWLVAMALCAGAFCARAQSIPVDGYAALVNERVITVGEVLAAMEPVRRQLEIVAEGEDLRQRLNEAYQTTLESLIEQKLIAEEFRSLGATIPDRIVDNYINDLVRDKFTNRVTLLRVLQEQRTTWEQWREEMRERLAVGQMRQREVLSRIVITPEQEQEAYEANLDRYKTSEEVWVRMIGLHKGGNEEEREIKKAEAERLRERILAGDDFAAVARTESEGPKAADGGDMGWRRSDDFLPELARVIKELELGQISPVVEAGDMFFILKLEGRKQASQVPFEEVRDKIREELRKSEEQRLTRMWVGQLRAKYNVQVFTQRLFN